MKAIILSALLLITSTAALADEISASSVEFIQYLGASDACQIADSNPPLEPGAWYIPVISNDIGFFNSMPVYCFYLEMHPELDVRDIQVTDIMDINDWLYRNETIVNRRFNIEYYVDEYSKDISSKHNLQTACTNIELLASTGLNSAFKVRLTVTYQDNCI